MAHWLIDGQWSETVGAADRGLHYGDGLFETLAIRTGRLEFWDRHMARLERGCDRLALPHPDTATLLDEVGRLWRTAGRPDRAVVKLLLTRGEGGRGYRPPAAPAGRRILSLHPWPRYPDHWAEQGIALWRCRTPLGSSPALAGLKHLNRLEQVVARAEWDDPAIAEGLMCDEAGNAVEGTMTNLFARFGGRLVTPDLSRGGVEGIARQVVLERAAELGIETAIETLPLERLKEADELFVTNAIAGLWPVASLGPWRYTPGPVGRRLREALEEARKEEGLSL